MESLREKIEAILEKEHYTFGQLAEHLNLTEAQLAEGLERKTLELRHLEEMSKSLKVPLYSFFRSTEGLPSAHETPVFTNRLWNRAPEKSPRKLEKEIALLRQAIAYKEAELGKRPLQAINITATGNQSS